MCTLGISLCYFGLDPLDGRVGITEIREGDDCAVWGKVFPLKIEELLIGKFISKAGFWHANALALESRASDLFGHIEFDSRSLVCSLDKKGGTLKRVFSLKLRSRMRSMM